MQEHTEQYIMWKYWLKSESGIVRCVGRYNQITKPAR